jgi:hypothetical protein
MHKISVDTFKSATTNVEHMEWFLPENNENTSIAFAKTNRLKGMTIIVVK